MKLISTENVTNKGNVINYEHEIVYELKSLTDISLNHQKLSRLTTCS